VPVTAVAYTHSHLDHFGGVLGVCMAENVTHDLHNILTPRGAEVRDARGWSRYLAEAIDLFGDDTDVAFASHHWLTWGAGLSKTIQQCAFGWAGVRRAGLCSQELDKSAV
jgi:alkyl sulfatase BDS1-like metallo-beta-lactamase superfamily hydrolase